MENVPKEVNVLIKQVAGLETEVRSLHTSQKEMESVSEVNASEINALNRKIAAVEVAVAASSKSEAWKEDLEHLRKDLGRRATELEEGIRNGCSSFNIEAQIHKEVGAVEERWRQTTEELVKKACTYSCRADAEVVSRKELATVE